MYTKPMIVKSGIATKVYRFILSYTLRRGKFPKLDEVAGRFKFTRERARQQMEKLCQLGYLRKQGKALHRSYTFRIVDLPEVNKTILKKIKVANQTIKNHYNAKRISKSTGKKAK